MKNKENYLIRTLLILIIIPSMWWYFSTKKRYREMNTKAHVEMEMKEYLRKTYNEEFDVIAIPYRSDNYCEAIITPKRYKGTKKESDPFYKSEVYIRMKKIPIIDEYEHVRIFSSYEDIRVKEGLEKGLKPKLEELFGKNVLIALQLEGGCVYGDYKKELEYRKRKGKKKPLSGGIYIFGRVENEKDREKYRRGIYEFIQYLKQEGMFEYTNITISITDERLLSRAYNESIDKKEIDNIVNGSIRYKKIKETLKKYTKDFEKTSQEYKNNLLNNMIKSKMFEEISHKGIFLLHTRIRSYKYVKSKGLDTDERFNETARNFNKEDDIRFSIEDYKI